MSENLRRLPSVEKWRTQTIRLTGFPLHPELIDESQWWEELVGSPPEQVTRKRTNREYNGVYNNVGLELFAGVDRIQWRLYPIIDPNDAPDEMPTIGDFVTLTGSFSSLMEEWLKTSPALRRLAFGAVIVQPMDSHAAGYELLNNYLSSVDVRPGTSDFLYQINRPGRSKSGIEGLQINRLTKWSVMAWQFNQMILGQTSPVAQIAGEKKYSARLELDINTPDDVAELPTEKLSAVWRELVSMAVEIATQGEQP